MSRIMLVTGGSRGIGAACALLAAQRGHDVAISYRQDEAAAQAVCAQIRAAGRRALAVRSDASVEAEIVALFERVDREFGRLDVLVNNAGIVAPAMRLETMTGERMARMFATNSVGPLICAREAVRRMSTRLGGAGGVIVNLSSAAARLGSPDMYIDYAASKAAIDVMTIGLSKEVAAEGIRVNAVRPGMIYTDIHADSGDPDRVSKIEKTVIPMKRGGTVTEIANSVLWLASDEASYVTGAILDVSGGR